MKPHTGSWPGLIAVWLVILLTALLTRPLLPVDETRYASVAWEMWSRGDFLVAQALVEPDRAGVVREDAQHDRRRAERVGAVEQSRAELR